MKKLLITVMMTFQMMLIFAQNPTITKIDEPNIKLGNKYFYAFEGAKWEWTLDLLGSKSTFSWSIIGVYKITDAKNGLTDKIGLQTKCQQLGTSWYFIENDGFLCKYEKNDSEWTITKFLPLSPKIGIKWMADSRQNAVTSVTDDFVKIEVEDDKKATSGYKLFRKNVGLYDLFEIEKNKKGQITTKWTLTKYIPPKIETPVTSTTTTTTTTTVRPAAAVSTTTTTIASETSSPASAAVMTPPTEQTVTPTVDKDAAIVSTTTTVTTTTTIAPTQPSVTYISALTPKTDYIQVGAFSQQRYAEDCCRKCMEAGYQTSILTDGKSYKVLIQPGDTPDILNKIKSDTGIDGFYKQHK